MYHAGHKAFVFRAYRQAVAVIPHGNDIVHEVALQCAIDQALQGAMHFFLGKAHGLPYMS